MKEIELLKSQKSPGKAEAEHLVRLYRDAQDGIKRIIALGLFCLEIKARLPHGQFEAWIKKHVDHDASDVGFKSLERYTTLTRKVLEDCGFQIPTAVGICDSPSRALMLPAADVPQQAKSFVAKITDAIEGKSLRQLEFDYKTPEDKKPRFGGGSIFEKFVKAKHPEMLAYSKPPTRASVPKAVRKEFDAWSVEQAADAKQREAAQEREEIGRAHV